MKTVCVLIPCLMRDNNRAVNTKYILRNVSLMKADKYIVYSQCFNDIDYHNLSNDSIEIIGNYQEPQGFVKTRNDLLQYFYSSDYDYAIWLDANSNITSSTFNSYLTLLDAIRNEKVDIDCAFSSIGIMNSQERINLASNDDYFDLLKLLPANRYSIRNCAWLHCCFMKNIYKYYMQTVFINSNCDPKIGLPEDAYLSTLLRQYYRCYLCPSIVVSKPPAKTSTWMNNTLNENGKATYGYPPIEWDKLEQMIKEDVDKKLVGNFENYNIIELSRVIDFKDDLKEFKSRKKVVQDNTRIDLF